MANFGTNHESIKVVATDIHPRLTLPTDDFVEDKMPQVASVDRNNPILDRCWASEISAIGGLLGIKASHEVIKKNYGKAAFYAGASALADFLDGAEARRFARRHPEAGLARQNEGGWTDQIWDRVRNIVIGAAILTVEGIPRSVKAVVGTMVAKEAVTGVIGLNTLANHYVQQEEGWPAPVPSADRGKEAMWEVGAGLSGILLGAKLKSISPELASKVTKSSALLCVIGLGRGLQTAPEYKRVIGEMAALTPEEQRTYEPNYKPHVLGRIARIRADLRIRLQDYNDMQGAARQESANTDFSLEVATAVNPNSFDQPGVFEATSTPLPPCQIFGERQ